MKKHLLFKLFTLTFALFMSVGWVNGQVHETFSNLGPYGGYQEETWTGDDGGTWTATDARTDQTIDGKAICIRDGVLTSPTISGGIGDLTLTAKRFFTGTDGNLDVKVNGNSVGTIPYTGTEATHTISDINITDDIVVTIHTPGNGDRVGMDNLIWTGYTASTNDPDSYVDATGVTQPTGTDISSLGWDESTPTATPVFQFNIADAGTADGLPTEVTEITIKAGTNNTADWTQDIGGGYLYKESTSTPLTIVTEPDVQADQVTFYIENGELDIADGGSELVTLY